MGKYGIKPYRLIEQARNGCYMCGRHKNDLYNLAFCKICRIAFCWDHAKVNSSSYAIHCPRCGSEGVFINEEKKSEEYL